MRVDLHSPQVRSRATYIWIGASLVWSLARSLAIRDAFGSHGTNAWIYLVVDLVTTVPYSIFSARAAFAWVDRSAQFMRNAVWASIFFIAPDFYVVESARHVHKIVWLAFGLWIVAMAALATKHARDRAANR